MTEYYEHKIEKIKEIFGVTNLILTNDSVRVGSVVYPIVDDVIILLHPAQFPRELAQRLAGWTAVEPPPDAVEKDIQETFGAEWDDFPEILPEHELEFEQYFDMVDIDQLRDKTVCDLGCGIGRWSHFLSGRVRDLVLVDFSQAIFVARRNLAAADNVIFFMGDIRHLPFRDDFADFLICLGVLHHLSGSALEEVRRVGRYAPRMLIYLYSALDARPSYYRLLLAPVNLVRRIVWRVRNPVFRSGFTWVGTFGLYFPLIWFGKALRPFGLANRIPLYDFYHDKSVKRIRQDVYDRFFTRIERRYSRAQIMTLTDTFQKITISQSIPYWHFLSVR